MKMIRKKRTQEENLKKACGFEAKGSFPKQEIVGQRKGLTKEEPAAER